MTSADTILPETDTPGARAAGVGPFIAMMVADTYYESDRQIFRRGLQTLQTKSLGMNGAHFQVVAPAQRLRLLQDLDGGATFVHGDPIRPKLQRIIFA